jgi:hypothetical protein
MTDHDELLAAAQAVVNVFDERGGVRSIEIEALRAALAGSATPTDTGPSTRSEAGGGELVRPVGERRAEQPARPVAGSATPTGHTRTSTPEGPDYCAECSAAINDWVPWPCSAGTGSATPTGDDDER